MIIKLTDAELKILKRAFYIGKCHPAILAPDMFGPTQSGAYVGPILVALENKLRGEAEVEEILE